MTGGMGTFYRALEKANEADREAEHARQHRESMTPEYRAELDRGYL